MSVSAAGWIPERLLGQIQGFFWIKMGTAVWHSAFLSGAAFPFLSFHFWEGHLDCKDFSSRNKNKNEDDFCFLWEYSANTAKSRIVLTTCQRTCHLFLCFTHLLGCSLMCSDTSALALQLTDPAPLSYWTKGQFSKLSVLRGKWVLTKCKL